MIDLHRDSILLVQENGEAIPFSAADISFDVVGPSIGSSGISTEILRQCTAGIVHYFKSDLGRSRITLAEFSEALVRVLAGFGYDIEVTGMTDGDPLSLEGAKQPSTAAPDVVPLDLQHVAMDAGKMGELEFFPRLKTLMDERMAQGPRALDCHGLRPAVKQLLGRKQWSPACRELERRIVETLRHWYRSRALGRPTGLVVR